MVINHFINVTLEILIYFLVSIVCLFIGRKVLDWITPYDLDKQTSEEKNLAAGITEAGFYISMAIIVHASVTGVVNYEMFSFINPEDINLSLKKFKLEFIALASPIALFSFLILL